MSLAVTPLPAQESLCEDAREHLVERAGMVAVVERDTIDDWRMDKMVPGCRVTAAGVTTRTLRSQARRFYDELPEAGWVRTPDPQDAPNEASLRFRRRGADCLFNFYSGGLLGTDAELEVDDRAVPGPGERRYNFLVLCTPAADPGR